MHTPNTRLQRLTDASIEPVTLAEAKAFLRLEIANDDLLVTALIKAARMECEKINDRSFINTQWKMTLDYFPPYSSRWSSLLPPAIVGPLSDRNYWLNLADVAIQFPYPPLVSVDFCTYIDPGGTLRVLDTTPAAQLVSVSTGTPGQMTPAFTKIFPVTQPTLGAVNITYTAGYGASADAVPESIKLAIMFLVANYYEHRSDAAEVPGAVQRLLDATAWGAYS